MKRKIILTSLIALLLSLSPAFAQPDTSSQPVSQAESDYRYQFDLYRDAYNQYQVKKASFLGSNTLKAEQEALLAAKSAASHRDDVLLAYTRWLDLRLLTYQDIYPQTANISSSLLSQSNFFLDHKSQVEAVGDSQTLTSVNQTLLDRQEPLDRNYFQAQTELKLAQLTWYHTQAAQIFDPLKTKLLTLTSIPEVEQGLSRVNTLTDSFPQKVSAISQLASDLVNSKDVYDVTSQKNKIIEQLQSLYTDQETIFKIMVQLEVYYEQQ